MKILIALFGESGSGKDSIAKKLEKEYGYHKIKRITSRPMREGESQGDPYLFVDANELRLDITENVDKYLEVGQFNDWLYATHIDSLEKQINVGTYDIDAVRMLLDDKMVYIIPIYVYVDAKTRMLRLLNREENPDIDEICRRYQADKKDYKHGLRYPCELVENIDIEKAIKEIKEIVDFDLDTD
jgi:guanylate kinase